MLHLLSRINVAAEYFYDPLKNLLTWLVHSREDTNFTYHLNELNKLYLASFVVQITDVDLTQVQGYLDELEHDTFL